MRSMPSPAERIAYNGAFLALALGFSYVETWIPVPFGVPGMKLGLANIAIIAVLYEFGARDALMVSLARVLLSGLLFGNLFALAFGAAGALLSLVVMALAKRFLSIWTVSALGGVTHNLGQFLVGLVLIDNFNIFFYLPLLLCSGVFTGILTGAIGNTIIKGMERYQSRKGGNT